MITKTDVLHALDHARLDHLPPLALPAQLLAMLLTQLAFVLPSAVTDSSLDLKLVTLETATPQDVSTARSSKDIPALDNPQSAELPLQSPL